MIVSFLQSPFILLLGIGLSILGAAFFTCSETALISCDRSYLRKLQREGNQSAALVLILLNKIDSLLITTQFGSNFFVTSATTLSTIYSIVYFGHENDWRVFFVLTPILLLCCDTLPKILARQFSQFIALHSVSILTLMSKLFFPITSIFSVYTKRISKWTGAVTPDSITLRKRARKQLLSLLSDKAAVSGIKVTQKRMIRNILNFSNQTVRKAMIPLVNVDAIESDSTITQAISLFETLRHSRIPVYSDRVDNIIGILHFMDLFACENLNDRIETYIRKGMYVPEHQQLEALILEMNIKEEYMAIVVDEYGGAIGIITEEDVLEEVVGNLSDEFDENTLNVHQVADNSFLANVNIEINDLNERLNTSLPKGSYETLAGFLLQQFNRIPSVGDELFFSDLKITVYRANERAIQSVIITKIKKTKHKV